jgi:polyhydroxyalkanoate synthesis regulator phasin
MPAAKSSSGRSGKSGGQARSAASSGRKSAARNSRGTGTRKRARSNPSSKSKAAASGASNRTAPAPAGDRANIAEQLANRIIRPLDLIIISRERIQQTLDEAAERGRVTRADANELVTELVNRGRTQTDDLLKDLERMLDRGRDQIETATRRVRSTDSVDMLVRAGDRARRTVGVGPSFPILGYDELTAGQVEQRLTGLKPAELRKVRDYERRHANRKSVLSAIERALD